MSVTKTLARFGIETNTIPESALAVMRLSFLDWIAVSIAGKDEPVAKIVRDKVEAEGGNGEASIIGLTTRLPARAAAFSNGTTSHALDYDDTHFAYVGHPSAAVLPAALAVGEKLGASARATLEAGLIGVEGACRTGAWLGSGHYDHGFHQTATSGTFGATLAACRLMGLNVERTCHALGVAASLASGLKSQFGTMGKPMHAGLAAQNGVDAATFAASGFISRPDALECTQGFAATHAGEMNDDALSGLGETFLFETVQHKFHACCHGLHPTLNALIEARDRHGLTYEDVATLTTRVHPKFLKVCNIEAPTTGLEAKFSYRLTSAMVLLGHDTADLSTYTDELCRDKKLISLRDRVSVESDTDINHTAAHIVVKRPDGTAIEGHSDLTDPMTYEERKNKVLKKGSALLGADRAGRIWDNITHMDKANHSTSLSALTNS